MGFLNWVRPEMTAIKKEGLSPAEQKQQVAAQLRFVQAGTLIIAAKRLELRASMVDVLTIKTILMEEAHAFRSIANTLSPEGSNVRV